MIGDSDPVIVRDANPSEIVQLAQLWFDGWQDAHVQIVPPELVRLRTLPRFEQRLRAPPSPVRVAEVAGAPVGFYFLKAAELYQFYVASGARGSGIAAILMADAEARLNESVVAQRRLSIDRSRRARFPGPPNLAAKFAWSAL